VLRQLTDVRYPVPGLPLTENPPTVEAVGEGTGRLKGDVAFQVDGRPTSTRGFRLRPDSPTLTQYVLDRQATEESDPYEPNVFPSLIAFAWAAPHVAGWPAKTSSAGLNSLSIRGGLPAVPTATHRVRDVQATE
jgi:hypothetical protein